MERFEKFVVFMQTEMKKPTLFGGAHLFWIAVAIALVVLICLKGKKISDKVFRTTLLVVGGILIILEVFKQINFAYEDGVWAYDWKQFPFQFCSVPMYVMIIAGCLKPCKFRDYLCCFLATFGFFAGAIVTLYPSNVLSPIIFRFSQSMIHHVALMLIGLLMFVSGKVKIEHKTIFKGVSVFSTCVVIAFIMNIIYHSTGNPDSFNMFYIGPHSKSDLPVFETIGYALKIESDNVHFGNFAFILLYILAFFIAAYVVLLIAMFIRKLMLKGQRKKMLKKLTKTNQET